MLDAFRRLTLAVAFIGAAALSRQAAAAEGPDISAIMRLTVESWLASQNDGFFPYGFDFLAGKELEPDRLSEVNLIRQTGAAFTLARYYELVGDTRLEQPIARTLTALSQRMLPIRKGGVQRILEETRILSLPFGRWKLKTALDRMGLLYQPSGEGKVISPDGTYRNAIAGTVALALLTELIYSHGSGDQSFAALRTAWVEGLLALRIPGGGFRQDPTLIDDTDFDNGEAWLALAVYADMHSGDSRVQRALADLDEALLLRYSENPTPTFIGWGGMAAAQRYRTTRDPRFLAYLRTQADNFVARFRRRLRDDNNNCPTLEGVTATLAVLEEAGENDTDRSRALRDWVGRELTKMPRLQIQRNQQELELGGGAELQAPRMREYAGGFLLGLYEPTTRVDMAAHCLSAMVTAERHHLH